MTWYPILFGFRDLIAGNGFLAGVAVNGRALLVRDDEDGYSMYGVNPGGMCAGGADVGEAQRAFREEHRKILFDIAADAENFEEFKAEAERFFDETNERMLLDWNKAVQQVRAGQVEADWLQRVDSDKARLLIEVTSLPAEHLQPSFNTPDEKPLLAAA